MAENQRTEPNPSSPSSLDSLYCTEEEEWVDEEEVVSQIESCNNGEKPVELLWESDEELISLFSKEEKLKTLSYSSVSMARQEAVDWMLKVISHYGFSPLTSILAINYLDRFISTACYQKDKPWMIQLVAVTCLSLAAKVEEIQPPLLLDFQVEDAKYVFEARTIQRMELLVLSTLKWKMHPVTPLSFLNHIISRLGLKTNLHWQFLRRCEILLLSVIADSRFIGYLPSVLATAAMMHVIDQLEPFNSTHYQNQLLGVLKLTKEKVNGCYREMCEIVVGKKKRKLSSSAMAIPMSPNGVIDAVFSSDSSNDSWGMGSSSPEPEAEEEEEEEALLINKKRSRTQEQQWVFVDVFGAAPP